MEPTLMAALLAGGLLISLLPLALSSSKRERQRRLLKETLRSNPATVLEGRRVRLTGQVIDGGRTVLAPISGRPCVAYEATLVVYARGQSKSTVIQRKCAIDFSLRDGDDVVEVRARSVDLVLKADHQDSSAWGGLPVTPAIDAILAEESLVAAEVRIEGFAEGILEAGETVSVLGVARWSQAAVGHGYRGTGRRLALEPPRDDALLISDEAGFGD